MNNSWPDTTDIVSKQYGKCKHFLQYFAKPVTVQTYARATEHMETPRLGTSESVSRLDVSMCDSGWQRVNSNLSLLKFRIIIR